MENDANTDWFKGGQNFAKARELLKEGGYDGRPVIIMQATNIAIMSNTTLVLAQAMRQAGINVQVEAMDWSNVVQRRASKAPPSQGGWNIFITWSGGAAIGNPILLAAHAATGDKAWFGWPCDAEIEKLRDAWTREADPKKQFAIIETLQRRMFEQVPYVTYGQWFQQLAYRSNVKGVITSPQRYYWNIRKE